MSVETVPDLLVAETAVSQQSYPQTIDSLPVQDFPEILDDYAQYCYAWANMQLVFSHEDSMMLQDMLQQLLQSDYFYLTEPYEENDFEQKEIASQVGNGWFRLALDSPDVWVLVNRSGDIFPYQFPRRSYSTEYETVFPPLYLSAGKIVIRSANHQFALMDTHAVFLTDFRFDGIGSFQDGIAQAKQGKQWGYIDQEGKWIVEDLYDEVREFNYWEEESAAPIVRVMRGDKWGYFLRKEKRAIPCVYDEVRPFIGDIVAVSKAGKWGYIDRSGKTVIPFEYDDIRDFSEGLAAARWESKWGFIDREGKWVIDPTYAEVGPMQGGRAQVTKSAEEEGWGFVDKQGNMLIPAIYSMTHPFNEGVSFVTEDGYDWHVIDRLGHTVLEGPYEVLFNVKEESFTKADLDLMARGMFQQGTARVFIDGRCVEINTSGKIIRELDEDECRSGVIGC